MKVVFLQEVEMQGHNRSGSNFQVIKANLHWIEIRFD